MRKTVKIQKKLISSKKDVVKRHVYTITIPEKIMRELDWKEGTELAPQLLTEDLLAFKKIK